MQKEIESDLPEKLGLILDKVSENGSGSQYVGFLLCTKGKSVRRKPHEVCFFLLDETDFSAKSHMDFTEATLTFLELKIAMVLVVTVDCSILFSVKELIEFSIFEVVRIYAKLDVRKGSIVDVSFW